MDSTLHLLDDLDGWPVRLDDEEMDLLDFDNAIPGSFGDFAAWMSGVAEATEVMGASQKVHLPPDVTPPNPGPTRQPMAQGGALDTQYAPDTTLTQPAGQAVHNGVTVPEQQQQIKIENPMRQNSPHSQALSAAPSSLHRVPSAHDSFRSQHSGGRDAAALAAAAGKAQQLLLSASSGFQASVATPAVTTPAAGGFLAPQALGGGMAFPPSAFSPPQQHHHPQAGGVLLASPAATAGQQAALLLGGGHHSAAAAMAAAMQQHSNPFAAAAAAAGLPGYAHAAALQGMGFSLGPGGQIHAVGHQGGYALHPSALHTLVGHGVLKHSAIERQQKARKKNTVASLEAELSEKLSQLQLLSAENEMLKLRAGVLEATSLSSLHLHTVTAGNVSATN